MNMTNPVVDAVALKPCPFCGGAGDIESQPSYSQAANTYERHRGWCNQCGFGLDWHNYEPEAISAWNTRQSADAALVEALEALKSAPIPGRGEEMMAFRERQDKWLRETYSPALTRGERT